MKKINLIIAAVFLLLLTNCGSESSKKTSKKEDLPPTSVASLPKLTSEQVEMLSMYKSLLNKVAIEDCNDWFDKFASGMNTAQDLLLDIYGEPISEQDEKNYGIEFSESIQKEFRFIDSDSRRSDLVSIMNKMLPYRSRKGINYTMHLIEHDMVNAFSTVGGNIHVTTGLLDQVQSTDELAFIIGHEIAHVDKKHCTRKIQLLKTANAKYGDKGVLAANIHLFLTAPFGQADEFEADRVGATFAHKAGYNASKGLDFFKELKKNEKPDEWERLLRTHPYSANREKCLNNFITNGYE